MRLAKVQTFTDSLGLEGSLFPADLVQSPRRSKPSSQQTVRLAGRHLTLSPVFETYWRFASERQQTYYRRLEGGSGPWTSDPIIANHRFTNAYRASDRVSQYLIRHVIFGSGSRSWADRVFRTLLFKSFNRIDTWEALEASMARLDPSSYNYEEYASVLDVRKDNGVRNYSAAYVIPPPRFGENSKHRNHLRLLELMMESDLPDRLLDCGAMSEAYELLHSFPSIGDFLAYQFLIDLNYASDLGFSEMDFVVAGPGARDGIRKCFGPESHGIEPEIIRWMSDTQEEHFESLGIDPPSLWGRRLQLIDIQNLFCEVDKYARVAHPTVEGVSGRSKIKQMYCANAEPLDPWFPPSWGLNEMLTSRPSFQTHDDRARPRYEELLLFG